MGVFQMVIVFFAGWGVPEWTLFGTVVAAVAAILGIFSPVLFQKEKVTLKLESVDAFEEIRDGEGGFVKGNKAKLVLLTIRNTGRVQIYGASTILTAKESSHMIECQLRPFVSKWGSSSTVPHTSDRIEIPPSRSREAEFSHRYLSDRFGVAERSQIEITATITLESGKVFRSNFLIVQLTAKEATR
jgi:hypothetical protein